MTQHPLADISRYADGELSPMEAQHVEAHLETCTECTRELALIKSMGEAMAQKTNAAGQERDLWGGVHRRITQPIGWILALAGLAVWAALGVMEWFRGELTLEWLAITAMVIGLALVAVAIGHRQYSEWRSSPYKDLER